MNKNIVLSIIIPAFNAEKNILKTLNSIIGYTGKQIVEIIIVNDGSTDGTLDICKKIIKQNKNINIKVSLVDQENAGHGSAINYGIRKAKGKYLRVLDADDYFDTKNFFKYLEFLSKVGDDLVISNYMEISSKQKVICWTEEKKNLVNQEYDKIIEHTSPALLPFSAVRTDILRNAGKFVDEKCYYDDQEYDFLIITLCKTVSYYTKPIYCYVVGNADQSISEKNQIKNIKDHEKVVKWLIKKYYETEISKEKKEFIFEKILVPLCYQQYFIAIKLKKSREDFLRFDCFLKSYKQLYRNSGVAGEKIMLHRLTKGLFIKI